jgi:hypothetical protein
MRNWITFGLAAVAGGMFASAAISAETFKGRCTVAAGATGVGNKHVTLKCARDSAPGDFVIRNTIWERDDKEGYRNLARFSGRRFSCTFTQSGAERLTGDGYVSQSYKMSNCR